MNGWIQPLDPLIEPETRADFFDGFLDYASYDRKLYGLFTETGLPRCSIARTFSQKRGSTRPKAPRAWDFEEFAEAARNSPRTLTVTAR